jgi:branched-chain amino acid transport system substrate-binding protein
MRSIRGARSRTYARYSIPHWSRGFGATCLISSAAIVSTLMLPSAASAESTSGNKASAPGITPTKITIGNFYSVTGKVAPQETQYGIGFDAYISKVNAAGGIHGRKITVVKGDDEGSSTAALANAQTLVEQKNVFAMAQLSFELGAFATYLHQQGVPVVGYPNGAVPAYQNGFSNMIDLGGFPSLNQNLGIKAFGKFLKQEGVTSLAIISDVTPSGVETAESSAAVAKLEGISVSYKNTTLPVGASANLGGVAADMKSAGANGVFFSTSPQTEAATLSAMQQAGYKPKFVLGNGISPAEYNQGNNGTLYKGTFQQLNFGTISPQANTKAAKTFRATIEKYGHQSAYTTKQFTYQGVLGYGIADAIVQGLQNAGQNPTRASFLAALKKIKNYTGAGTEIAAINLGDTRLRNPGSNPGPPYCVQYERFNGTDYVNQPEHPVCGGLNQG